MGLSDPEQSPQRGGWVLRYRAIAYVAGFALAMALYLVIGKDLPPHSILWRLPPLIMAAVVGLGELIAWRLDPNRIDRPPSDGD